MTQLNISTKTLFSKETLLAQKSLIALVVMIIIVSFLNPHFFTVNNFLNILQQTSVNAILAVGMTLVILSSGIDLSVGMVLALTGAIAASLIGQEYNVLLALGATVLLGCFIGSISGVIIAKGKVQPFIATLVMMLFLKGATLVFTGGSAISIGTTVGSDQFSFISLGRPFGIPMPIWMMMASFIAVWYLLKYTRLGRYIYAIGGNESAARLSGIRVDFVKIIVYALCGFFAAVASLIEVARLSSAQGNAGVGYELDAIAAVVLGGTSLAGGRGFIMGTLIGALILGVLNNGLNVLNVTPYYQMIVKAIVILIAVLIDNKAAKI